VNAVRDLSLRLITATLGVRCAMAADLDATPEEQNRRTVEAEIDELGEHLAVVTMMAEMMVASLIALGTASDRDPRAIWQQIAAGLAAEADE
jgi:hypothetical protein